MDQHDRSQRQQARQTYSQQHFESDGSGQSQSAAAGSNEGFRQSGFVQPPPVSATAGGAYGLASSPQYGAGSGMQPSPIQYGQIFAPTEAARQQGPQYSQYASNVMYGMAAAQGAQAIPSSYEQIPPYRQQPGSGSETMSAQFGVSQYYLAGQAVPTAGNVGELSTQQIPTQYAQPDTYPVTGPSAVHSYSTATMEPSQPGIYDTYAQQAHYTPQFPVPSNEQPFDNYQLQIRNIFTLARDGGLRDIGAHLLEVSQYLLGNVEALGLTRDDETLHDGRIRLWDEFNRAWLVSLQRQIDLSQQMMRTNQPLEGLQSIMDAQTLERLSSELVRLCDSVEKHGLVDYQMGVAEEEIMELLLRCQSVLDPGNGRTTGTASDASRGGASRRR